MSIYTASASGKIILSGEYAVVFGYPGIAVPAPLTMVVTHEESAEPLVIDWSAGTEWKSYATKIAERCRVTTGTITIRTQLPLGKGMGSSTALVIAMARCFELDRAAALTIEDAVNPGHSGLDFAVIWSGMPVLFHKDRAPEPAALKKHVLKGATLIDTGRPRETTPELVAWVKERAKEPAIKEALVTIGRCTERILAGEPLMTVIPDHHAAQVALGVVPEQTQLLIKKIVQVFGPAKVIGAGGRTGGGGMILTLGTDHKALEEALGGAYPVISL